MGMPGMESVERHAMAGGAVAGRRLVDGRADQGAAGGVMTTGAGVVGIIRRTHQGVVMAVGTRRRCHGDDAAMVGCGRRMQCFPGAGMAGGAVA